MENLHLEPLGNGIEIYDTKREEKNPFINRLREADPSLYEDMVKYGRRNIACLTIAPTGTTSLMTQTTSGIEPVFLPVYKRRRKVNPNDTDARVDFVDETVGIAILHNAANLFGLFHVNGIIFIVGDDKNLIFPRALIVILYIIV